MRASPIAALILALAPSGMAAAEPVVELAADEEASMALSAAPEHLRARAGVYRLGVRGFDLVRPSTNGFNCLVAREPSLGLGPLCFDKEGSETLLKAELMQGELMRQGRSETEIAALVAAAFAAGRLAAPRRPGVAYMLSNNFSSVDAASGKRRCIFPPHLMFYAPYMKNADIGAEPGHRGSVELPWILNEGKPNAYILVVGHGADAAACG